MMYIIMRRDERSPNFASHIGNITQEYMQEVMVWTKSVYAVLCVALEHGHLESNYIPGYNLFQMYSKYYEHKDTALQYAEALQQILPCNENSESGYSVVDMVVQSCRELILGQVKAATSSTS